MVKIAYDTFIFSAAIMAEVVLNIFQYTAELVIQVDQSRIHLAQSLQPIILDPGIASAVLRGSRRYSSLAFVFIHGHEYNSPFNRS